MKNQTEQARRAIAKSRGKAPAPIKTLERLLERTRLLTELANSTHRLYPHYQGTSFGRLLELLTLEIAAELDVL